MPRTLSLVPELSDEELNALVEEATVDAYGDEEQLSGFAVMIKDNLAVQRTDPVVLADDRRSRVLRLGPRDL